MSEITLIEWTDATWNPVAGCAPVSEGCKFCYATRLAARLDAMGMEKYQGLTRKSGGRSKWTGEVRLFEAVLEAPLRWRKPRRVFVNSMSDLFHEDVPVAFVRKVWKVMEKSPQHTFQVLTKRPQRMRKVLSKPGFSVLPNVLLGTSVENAGTVHRIDDLRGTPAAKRFISFEPLIGPIKKVNLDGIDWAIVGGESGPGARRMEESWVLSLMRQCRRHDVAFFFKQWGGVNKKATGRLLRGKTYDEMPLAH